MWLRRRSSRGHFLQCRRTYCWRRVLFAAVPQEKPPMENETDHAGLVGEKVYE
jgi:hypothetical protein